WEVDYPLFAALRHDHLAQVLLLLWYTPESYKTITVVAKEYKYFHTLQSYIKTTGEIEAEEGKHRDYVRWVNETAADAKQVRELLTEAKRYLEITPRTAENGEKAARCYQQAAQIYQKHEELEDSLVYFRPSYTYKDSATPKQLHALLKDYYRQKKLSCLEQEFNCYQLAERELVAVAEEDVKHHVDIINRLVELGKLLVKEAELRFYLSRAAELMMRLPDRRASEATTVSDGEVAIEFAEEAEVASERASLLEHKPANTTSFFGALSTLRRRHVPVVTTEVSQHKQTFSLKS
ncbi:MAG TPA: hypothetical protein VD770_04800, partial [Coxiellaceae bacterium]|nr:hypothetical protein [Coxiellaceae bacterium]